MVEQGAVAVGVGVEGAGEPGLRAKCWRGGALAGVCPAPRHELAVTTRRPLQGDGHKLIDPK